MKYDLKKLDSVEKLREFLRDFYEYTDDDAYSLYSTVNRFLRKKGITEKDCPHKNKKQSHTGGGKLLPGRYTCLDCKDHVFIQEEEDAS